MQTRFCLFLICSKRLQLSEKNSDCAITKDTTVWQIMGDLMVYVIVAIIVINLDDFSQTVKTEAVFIHYFK